jgi:hypothetical protein
MSSAITDDRLGALAGKGEGKLRAISNDAVRAQLPFRLPGSTRDGLAVLIERDRFTDAALVLAYALPEREAVWWASMCTRGVSRPLTEGGVAALEAAEAWVRRPMPSSRPALIEAAKGAGYETPAAYVARAAYAARLDDPCSSRAGRRIERSLRGMLEALDAPRRDLVLRRFVESGCDVAAGGPGRIRPAESQLR